MNFDRFKDIKLDLKRPQEYDEKYVSSLASLGKKPDKKRILPIIGTLAASLIVVVGVTLWAVIGRGVRGAGPQDTPTVPSDASCAEKSYPFESITADGITGVTFTLREHSSHEGISRLFTTAEAIDGTVDYLKKVSARADELPEQDLGAFAPYILTLGEGGIKYTFEMYRYADDRCYCVFSGKDGERGTFIVEDGSLYELIYYVATIDGREPAWNYQMPLNGAIERLTDVYSISVDGTEYKKADGEEYGAHSTVAQLTRTLPLRKAKGSDGKWDKSLLTHTLEYEDADGNLLCKIVTNLDPDGKNNNYHIKLYTKDADGVYYMAEKKHFDKLLEAVRERLGQTLDEGYVIGSPFPPNPETDGLETVAVNTDGFMCGSLENMYAASDLVVLVTPADTFSESEKASNDYIKRKCTVDKVYKSDGGNIDTLYVCERARISDNRILIADGEYIMQKGKKYLLFLYRSNNDEDVYMTFSGEGKYDVEYYKTTDDFLYPELLEEIKAEFTDLF